MQASSTVRPFLAISVILPNAWCRRAEALEPVLEYDRSSHPF